MRRSAEDAILALRTQIVDWGRNSAQPDLRILAYPPAWEAAMMGRIRGAAADLANEGLPIEVVDAGDILLEALEARPGLRERLEAADHRSPADAFESLGAFARSAFEKLLRQPLPEGDIARVIVNTGALATLVSYSQITSEFFGTTSDLGGATILAFPGDADERSLNLLGLRVDTAYRAPRI